MKSAKILASWVCLWDVPCPEGPCSTAAGFRPPAGPAATSSPRGSYLDNEFLEFTGDLADVAVPAGNRRPVRHRRAGEYGMQYGLSTPDQRPRLRRTGIQCEGVITSYWLSAPDTTEFSGAVNKVKGDDNDTCNALTNGQAAYGIYDL